jgi:hypothetical protein
METEQQIGKTEKRIATEETLKMMVGFGLHTLNGTSRRSRCGGGGGRTAAVNGGSMRGRAELQCQKEANKSASQS